MLPMCFWGVFVEMYIVSLFYYPNDSFLEHTSFVHGDEKKKAKPSFFVGMTRLERATPWSQTKYTTNCTTSRVLFLKSGAKVNNIF